MVRVSRHRVVTTVHNPNRPARSAEGSSKKPLDMWCGVCQSSLMTESNELPQTGEQDIVRAKKKIEAPTSTITLTVMPGDVALAAVPGECYLARRGKMQPLAAVKVTAQDVRFTLKDDHPLVETGTYAAGTRFCIPTPSQMAYYIGNADQGKQVGETMVASVGATFELDLEAPGVTQLKSKATRGARLEETQKAESNPQRKIQNRNKAQRFAIRTANAQLLRIGQPAMTQEETNFHLRSMGL